MNYAQAYRRFYMEVEAIEKRITELESRSELFHKAAK